MYVCSHDQERKIKTLDGQEKLQQKQMISVYYSCRCFAAYTSGILYQYMNQLSWKRKETKLKTVVYKWLKRLLLVQFFHNEKPGS